MNEMGQGKVRVGGSYVVVPCRPCGVQLHVELSLFSGQLVVLGLFLSGQRMPLQTTNRNEINHFKPFQIQSKSISNRFTFEINQSKTSYNLFKSTSNHLNPFFPQNIPVILLQLSHIFLKLPNNIPCFPGLL